MHTNIHIKVYTYVANINPYLCNACCCGRITPFIYRSKYNHMHVRTYARTYVHTHRKLVLFICYLLKKQFLHHACTYVTLNNLWLIFSTGKYLRSYIRICTQVCLQCIHTVYTETQKYTHRYVHTYATKFLVCCSM